MLLDFEEHRLHRRALSVAFKSGPMQSYLTGLNAGIAKGLSQWPRGREFEFYPAITMRCMLSSARPCIFPIASRQAMSIPLKQIVI